MKIKPFDYASIVLVHKESDFDSLKELFLEFAISIDFDLSYQGFLQELGGLAEQYNTPSGAAFLLNLHGISVGCIGIRKINPMVAEIKRFYIRSGSVGPKYKKMLMEVAIDWARQLGIKKIRLNTQQSMASASKVCLETGFLEISPKLAAMSNPARMFELPIVGIEEYFSTKAS
ncbi:MAG: GNAT family N-acetyltransferase [Bacteroidales bacterium]|nr:GNAT family N-acetyltransferase [Bacteroidales bacterium]